MRGLAVALVVGLAAPVLAGPRVAGVVLPTRRADAGELSALARRLAAAVASRLHGEVVALAPSDDLAQRLARARTLALDAKLDEAAATYDLALDAADRDPTGVDAGTLIAAHVARAQIALARGENARADALLARVLAWDGDFTATADENTPAVQSALARVREQAAAPRIDIGDACRHADTTIVVHAVAAGGIEVARFDGCTRGATAAATRGSDDAALVDELAPAAKPSPAPASNSPGLLHRPVFWIVVSAVAVSAGVIAWRETRDSGGGYDVAIHF